jgi:MHS family alpha-ketoglutarate permease-like MFS transporter
MATNDQKDATVEPSADPAMAATNNSSWRAVTAGAVGNFVEFFDWTVYGYMVPVFAHSFFPTESSAASLLLAVSTFAVGFLMRPIGGIVLGRFADARGRRGALSLSILLMGVGSLVLGLLPGFATIGIAAPILLVLTRLLQGFSAGGEGGASSSYLLEFAPPGRRALAGSWRDFSSGVSTFAALGVATLVTSTLPAESLSAWGWRIPFLLGAALALVGLVLRRSVDETPVFEAHRKARAGAPNPVGQLVRRDWRALVTVTLIGVLPTVAFLSWQIYLPTYAASVGHLPLAQAQQSALVGTVAYLICLPFSALLADRIGRRPMMITFAVASIVWAYPTYVLMTGSRAYVLLVAVVGNVILAIMAGCLTAAMAEQFPTATRGSGVGVAYAIGVSIVGGTFPVLVTYLSGQNARLAIFFVVVALAIVSLIAYIRMPETKNREL